MKDLMKMRIPELTPAQLDQFNTYYEMLTDWNTRMNLTTITEKGEVARKHFHDSVRASAWIPEGANCIDVGTGAGFPGVPLMILRPDLKMTLLDSLDKRLGFLDALLKELKLHAELVHARAEDAGQDPKYRERYDIALSRAVAGLPTLLELTVPFVKVGGTAIAYKGAASDELYASISAAEKLKVELTREDITIDYGRRTLILAKKVEHTAPCYPRKAGTPGKKPL